MTLTQSKVDKLQPKDKRYVVADSGGLSVCVQSSGAKTFQLRYRIHGRQKTLTFGDISLKDARAKAQAARVAIYKGVDPQEKAVLRKEKLVVLSAVFFSGLAMAQSIPVFGTAKFGQAVFGGASVGTTGADALPVPFMPLWAAITLAVALWVVAYLMRSKEN